MDRERWMRRALRLAERGRWTVSPNPLVGCVLVRDGEVVGEGWHERAGGPHAEVRALAAAGPAARGATAYVTLEPCDHRGRTGPCTQALVDAGVARVFAALEDPHPRAAGGAARLRAAGVPVEVGLLAGDARRQNVVFLHGLASGRPHVTVKSAVSLDGRIAAADGTSRWLTGPEARTRAHELRAEADAVLVGTGTVVVDDPQLTVRLDVTPPPPQPLRVVLDRRGRVGPAHRAVDGAAPSLVLTAEAGVASLRARLDSSAAEVAGVAAAAGDQGLDLTAVLAALWERGVRSVLVEGGAAVAASFLREGLADRLVVHVAPLLLGAGGRPAVAAELAGTLAEAPRFRLEAVERTGDDTLLTLLPERPAAAGAARAGSQQRTQEVV